MGKLDYDDRDRCPQAGEYRLEVDRHSRLRIAEMIKFFFFLHDCISCSQEESRERYEAPVSPSVAPAS